MYTVKKYILKFNGVHTWIEIAHMHNKKIYFTIYIIMHVECEQAPLFDLSVLHVQQFVLAKGFGIRNFSIRFSCNSHINHCKKLTQLT